MMKIRLNKIEGSFGYGDTYSINIKTDNTETTIDLTTRAAKKLRTLLDVELD